MTSRANAKSLAEAEGAEAEGAIMRNGLRRNNGIDADRNPAVDQIKRPLSDVSGLGKFIGDEIPARDPNSAEHGCWRFRENTDD